MFFWEGFCCSWCFLIVPDRSNGAFVGSTDPPTNFQNRRRWPREYPRDLVGHAWKLRHRRKLQGGFAIERHRIDAPIRRERRSVAMSLAVPGSGRPSSAVSPDWNAFLPAPTAGGSTSAPRATRSMPTRAPVRPSPSAGARCTSDGFGRCLGCGSAAPLPALMERTPRSLSRC